MKKLPILLLCFFFGRAHAQCWETISAGRLHSLAIKPDGTLWAWGFNGSGQLGDGTMVEKTVPIQIGTASDWKSISAGGNHSMAIKNDGTLWVWGENLWGQLGDGSVGTFQTTPRKIGTATNWKSVSAGEAFSLAIRNDGTLWSWGDNFFGQLGRQSGIPFTPGRVGVDSDWAIVSGGANHTLAIKQNGTLWAWGHNSEGQVGDGSNTQRNTPVRIGVASDWNFISGGYDFSTALTSDGTIWVWGNNDMGQLGDGSYISKNRPVQAGPSSNWQAVSAGEDHTIAIAKSGSMWAWGWIIGGFGFGTENTRNVPTQLENSNEWHQITAGSGHALAFKLDGTLWGWGENVWGTLGDGTWNDQLVPTLLSTSKPSGEQIQTFCGSATIADLKVIGNNIRWYAAATGGAPLLNTVALVDGSRYYAAQVNNQCESLSRLEVTARINTIPTPAPGGSSPTVFCNSATVADLNANGENVKWYTSSLAGDPLPPEMSLTSGTVYYASQTINACESHARFALEVILNKTEPPSGDNAQLFCYGSMLSDLQATGEQVKWYASKTSSVPLPAATLLENGIHYYATQTINSLESCGRLEVLTTINSTLPPKPQGASEQFFCLAATVAHLEPRGANIRWYDGASGGTELPLSSSLIDGNHYYASQTVSACESPSRLDIVARINTIPTPMPTAQSHQTVCEGSTITTLAVAGENLKWYPTETSGSILAGNHSLIDGSNYFVTQTIQTCESSRLKVGVTLVENTTAGPLNDNPVPWDILFTTDNFSASIKSDGTLWGWGINDDWELADGTSTPKPVPTQIGVDTKWRSIAGGSNHLVAIKSDGTLWGWGYNAHGQSADGSLSEIRVPTKRGTETNWKSIAAGAYHNLAIKNDGSLWAWGDNYSGALGNGTQGGFKVAPTRVGNETTWKYISSAGLYNLAIKNDGTLWAWGYNSWGQLGDGTNSDKFVPTQIGTDSDWKMIRAGKHHALALKNNGTLWAWGQNASGQLGDGTKIPKNSPTQVGTSTDWKIISAGDEHSMAIRTDGTLWAWGSDYGYQLGDGSINYERIDQPSPVRIGEESDWINISAGYYHSLAVRSNGTLWGWGWNGYGEVGIGTTDDIFSNVYDPTLVLSASQSFCLDGVIADLSAAGNEIRWYQSLSAEVMLADDIPLINGNKYYATQTLNTCESRSRLEVSVSLSDKPAPAPEGTPDQTYCDGAVVADLLAIGNDIKWYSGSGVLPLAADTRLVDGEQYFASQTTTACESEARLSVAVSLTENTTEQPSGLSTQVFCPGTRVEHLIVVGSDIQWYNAPSGSTPLDPSTLLQDGAHYFATQSENSCESLTRFEVTATVKNIPPPSGSAAQYFCGDATIANLLAVGADVKWYVVAEGGSPLHSGTQLKHNTDYYASHVVDGCESISRLRVKALTTVKPTGNSMQSFCTGATIADLEATGSDIKWYPTPEGGNPLASSIELVHWSTYYASETLNSCESSSRMEVRVSIVYHDPPTGSIFQGFCPGATIADLSAVGSEIKWYAESTGGTALPSSAALTHGAFYYASQTILECESTSRLGVFAAFTNTIPPAGSVDQTFCFSATVDDLVAHGSDISWYNVPEGGERLEPTTPLTDGGHYYATQFANNCESIERLKVRATLVSTHPPTGNERQEVCDGATLSDLKVVGSDIRWYTSLASGTELPPSTLVTHNMEYFATQTVTSCESGNRLKIVPVVNPLPSPPSGPSPQSAITANTFFDLEVSGSGIKWYSSAEDAVGRTNELDPSGRPQVDRTYYATQTVFGCESHTALPVTVLLITGIEKEDEALSYYPNPVRDVLYISFSLPVQNVVVINCLGQTMVSKESIDKHADIDLAQLPSGVYTVHLHLNSGTRSFKVFKE